MNDVYWATCETRLYFYERNALETQNRRN